MSAGLKTTLAVVIVLVLVGAPRSRGEPVHGVNGRVVPNQLFVGLTVSPSATTVGKTVQARASLTNGGAQPLQNVSATVRFDPTGLVVSGSPTITVGTLDTLKTSKATWNVCAQQPANYVLVVSARGTRADGVQLVVDSPAVLLTVASGRGRC
jgi:hypothetical protein